jgi:hypothetical protein
MCHNLWQVNPNALVDRILVNQTNRLISGRLRYFARRGNAFSPKCEAREGVAIPYLDNPALLSPPHSRVRGVRPVGAGTSSLLSDTATDRSRPLPTTQTLTRLRLRHLDASRVSPVNPPAI